MQKVMFAKVELWLVLLLGIVGLIATVLFGAIVLGADRDHSFGKIGKVALVAAQLPETLKNIAGEDTRLQIIEEQRFAAKPAGWSFPSGKSAAQVPGYILISRYDADQMHNVVELVSLDTYEVAYSWAPEAEVILAGAARTSKIAQYNNWDNAHFRQIHPLLMENGDLITKDHYAPMFRLDACSRRTWMQDDLMFHHSNEVDADGNIWSPAVIEPQQIEGISEFFLNDALTKMSPKGEILFQRSLAQLLMDNGMGPFLFRQDSFEQDPMHLNDIQPVLSDGPYWKKGDVFVNIRNLSMVMLYRPSTDQIIWSKTGPWLSQHDVDILDDHRISVYNNDVQDRGRKTVYDGASDIAIYDFATDSVTRILADFFEREQIRTFHSGLYTRLPGNRTLIEDSRDGRLEVVSADGKVVADYVGRAGNGHIYQLGWSRYIDKDYGDRVLATVTKVDCNE
jgi:Arylsulfotransferase (ASST)